MFKRKSDYICRVLKINTIFLILKTVRVRGVSTYMFCHVWLFATPRTLACQAPLSTGFSSRILEWVTISSSRDPGILFQESSSRDSWPGIELKSPALAGRFFSMRHWERPSESLDNLPKTTYVFSDVSLLFLSLPRPSSPNDRSEVWLEVYVTHSWKE